MVTALNVANNILKRAFNENVDITPMKLQKLLYFAYKRYLQTTNETLFEEPFQTWRYGPVVESVYSAFKEYGANHIDKFYEDSKTQIWLADEDRSDTTRMALDFAWGRYSEYNGIVLSGYTHQPNTAWYKAVKKNSNTLDVGDIRKEEWL